MFTSDWKQALFVSVQILERTLEPDSSDEEPPPVYSPPSYDLHIYDRKYPEAPPTPPPRWATGTALLLDKAEALIVKSSA